MRCAFVVLALSWCGCALERGGLAEALTMPQESPADPVPRTPSQPSPSRPDVGRGEPEPVAPTPVDLRGASPFEGSSLAVDPRYTAAVDQSIAMAPDVAVSLAEIRSRSTAIWIDSVAKVPLVEGALVRARAEQARHGTRVTPTIVLHDLPSRECTVRVPGGDLVYEERGLERYRDEIIGPIAAAIAAHPDVPVAIVLEPNAFAYLATAVHLPRCAELAEPHEGALAHAIMTLAKPNVGIYLDAGHSGWLGWQETRTRVAKVFRRVLDRAGGVDKIRGFATNVANYTVLRASTERYEYGTNPCRDETSYVRALAETLEIEGIRGKGFVIDTSRNGRGGIRAQWSAWCNLRGASLGERPRIAPEPGIDAWLWIKRPGESDGTSDPLSPRYEATCGGPDALTPAPDVGTWFHAAIVELARNGA